MKNYWILAALISAVVFSGCQDAINSDPNKIEKRMEFGTIKSDQTKGVIMPLEEGRVWYYKETDYDANGNLSYVGYDSIVVLKEVTLNGKRWFQTQFYGFGDVNTAGTYSYLINTDTGLWFKPCDSCEAEIMHLAQFPVVKSPFLSGPITGDSPRTNKNELSPDAQLYAMASMFSDEFIMGKSYSGVKYNMYVKDSKGAYDGRTIMNRFHVIDVGLVKEEIYNNLGFPKEKVVYELVDKIEHSGEPVLRALDSIFFNRMDISTTYDTTAKVLVNISKARSVTVNNVHVTGDVDISYNMQPLPAIIKPGESFIINIRVSPTKQGYFEGTLFIDTSEGVYYIKIVGIGV